MNYLFTFLGFIIGAGIALLINHFNAKSDSKRLAEFEKDCIDEYHRFIGDRIWIPPEEYAQLLHQGRPHMLNELFSLFKSEQYFALVNIATIMNACLQVLEKDKFVNGDTDRDAAIDALCQLLKSHKSKQS